MLSVPSALAGSTWGFPCAAAALADCAVVVCFGSLALRWGDIWHGAEGDRATFRRAALCAGGTAALGVVAARIAGCVGLASSGSAGWAVEAATVMSVACVAAGVLGAVYGSRLAGTLRLSPLPPSLRRRRSRETLLAAWFCSMCLGLRAVGTAAVAWGEGAGVWRCGGACGASPDELPLTGPVGAALLAAFLVVLEVTPLAVLLVHHGAVPPPAAGGGQLARVCVAAGVSPRCLARLRIVPRRGARPPQCHTCCRWTRVCRCLAADTQPLLGATTSPGAAVARSSGAPKAAA